MKKFLLNWFIAYVTILLFQQVVDLGETTVTTFLIQVLVGIGGILSFEAVKSITKKVNL